MLFLPCWCNVYPLLHLFLKNLSQIRLIILKEGKFIERFSSIIVELHVLVYCLGPVFMVNVKEAGDID